MPPVQKQVMPGEDIIIKKLTVQQPAFNHDGRLRALTSHLCRQICPESPARTTNCELTVFLPFQEKGLWFNDGLYERYVYGVHHVLPYF